MRIISAILAVLTGWFTWGLVLSAPRLIGVPEQSDYFVLLTPFLGVTLWVGLAKMAQGKVASGLWIFAVSPLLGALNYFLYIALSSRGPNEEPAFHQASYTLAALWVVPFVLYVVALVAKQSRGT